MGIEKSAYLVFDKVCSDSCLSEVPGTNGRRQRIKLARWSWDTAIPQCRLYTGQSYMSIAKKKVHRNCFGWSNTKIKADDGYRWHCGCQTRQEKKTAGRSKRQKRGQRYSNHNANTYRWMTRKRNNNKESYSRSQRRFWHSKGD